MNLNNMMYRRDKGYLSCYGSGDGALHFVWCGAGGTANNSTVTRGDANQYLKMAFAKHLLERGWRVVQLWSQIILVADIKRVKDAANNLVKYEGEKYRYNMEGERAIVPHETQQNYHNMLLYTDGHLVHHISTKGAIVHFLSYEEELTYKSDAHIGAGI